MCTYGCLGVNLVTNFWGDSLNFLLLNAVSLTVRIVSEASDILKGFSKIQNRFYLNFIFCQRSFIKLVTTSEKCRFSPIFFLNFAWQILCPFSFAFFFAFLHFLATMFLCFSCMHNFRWCNVLLLPPHQHSFPATRRCLPCIAFLFVWKVFELEWFQRSFPQSCRYHNKVFENNYRSFCWNLARQPKNSPRGSGCQCQFPSVFVRLSSPCPRPSPWWR